VVKDRSIAAFSSKQKEKSPVIDHYCNSLFQQHQLHQNKYLVRRATPLRNRLLPNNFNILLRKMNF